jgi:nucleotide-binding universal stress UspA family protein
LLIGLGVVDEPGIRTAQPAPLGAGKLKSERDAVLLADQRRRIEQLLSRFSLDCAAAGSACKVLEEFGPPAERIQQQAQRYDLIVIGQQTFFEFQRGDGPCSTLDRLLQDSPRPVVVVPDAAVAEGPTLVGYDGSLQAARALQAFASLNLSDRVELVSIDPDGRQAARIAERARDYLAAHRIDAISRPVPSSAEPAAVLLEQIRTRGAELLVMGAYGQPRMKEFFLGSVTRTLLRDSPIPLFLFH